MDVPVIPMNAQPQNVATALGRPLSEKEETLTEGLLEQAWMWLLEDVPTLEERIGAGVERRLETQAGLVLVAAVTRVVRNPEGWRQVGLDDFQGTRDSVLSAGVLQFLPDELSRLQPRTAALPGAYSLRMGVPYWSD